MRARPLAAAFVVISAALAACSSDNVLGLGLAGGGTSTDSLSNARIRFVNASASSFDVASAGTVASGNASLGFGTASSCVSTSATSPNIAVRIAGSASVVAGLATAYQSGVSYIVVAHPGTAGTTQLTTIADTFTPVSGQIGLRAFNAGAAGTSYDVYLTTPGASLATETPAFGAVTSGTATSFLGVSTGSAQQVRITAAGSKVVLLDLGNVALAAGQNATLIVAPPLAGSATPRAFLASGCS
jgi:hypothetical protein